MARRSQSKGTDVGGLLLAAQASYADSMVRSAMGDGPGCIQALRRSHEILPTYAPAILALGSVEYQLRKPAEGRRLLLLLLELPDGTPDLIEVIDLAGDFLIQSGQHADGLELYRRAAKRFPQVAVFQQGAGCCAGHLGLHDEAIAASEAALRLEPDNQKLVNDLGWSLHQAGRQEAALRELRRAVAMDPEDGLAAENLRHCLGAKRRGGGRPARSPGRERS